MLSEQEILNGIFNIASETDFNTSALAVFHYQYRHNEVYGKYVKSLKREVDAIQHYTEIPFLPIEFFRSHVVSCKPVNDQTIRFSSSGTTGQITSSHYVYDTSVYEKSFLKGFDLYYGDPRQYCILALLPNYLERSGSSLVYMFNDLIAKSQHPLSGFYLHNTDELISTLSTLKQSGQQTILLGVTYALLDLADKGVQLPEHIMVMETGGMKGKRKEMIKEEVHAELKEKFGISTIHSEYGMTELLSQAYSKKDGLFECPPWMRVLIRDSNDPFRYMDQGRAGGINVVDLANLYSCSFIETKDLGKIYPDSTFEILGRFDNSDIRGCNLMIG